MRGLEIPQGAIPWDENAKRGNGFKNISGQKFGRLTVICPHYREGHRWYYRVKCECGKEGTVLAYSLPSCDTSSCGCRQREAVKATHTTHGHFSGGNTDQTYTAYLSAQARCRNPKNKKYADYGGRGIEFEFSSFEEFLAAVGEHPGGGYSLDRIDNDGHYEAGNVRWATYSEQNLNQRSNRCLTVMKDGLIFTGAVKQVAGFTGEAPSTIGMAASRSQSGFNGWAILIDHGKCAPSVASKKATEYFRNNPWYDCNFLGAAK